MEARGLQGLREALERICVHMAQLRFSCSIQGTLWCLEARDCTQEPEFPRAVWGLPLTSIGSCKREPLCRVRTVPLHNDSFLLQQVSMLKNLE